MRVPFCQYFANPIFTGFASITIEPVGFHPDYVFDDDLQVNFTATDFAGLTATCSIQFTVLGKSAITAKIANLY